MEGLLKNGVIDGSLARLVFVLSGAEEAGTVHLLITMGRVLVPYIN